MHAREVAGVGSGIDFDDTESTDGGDNGEQPPVVITGSGAWRVSHRVEFLQVFENCQVAPTRSGQASKEWRVEKREKNRTKGGPLQMPELPLESLQVVEPMSFIGDRCWPPRRWPE